MATYTAVKFKGRNFKSKYKKQQIVISLGIDGIWSAVVITLTIEMVLFRLPAGKSINAITGISKASLIEILDGVEAILFFMIC